MTIRSMPPNDNYRVGWERAFGRKRKPSVKAVMAAYKRELAKLPEADQRALMGLAPMYPGPLLTVKSRKKAQ
jgi:hypothetical protein